MGMSKQEEGDKLCKESRREVAEADVNINKANREDMQFLDLGCSNHMCGKKDYFLDFDGSFSD